MKRVLVTAGSCTAALCVLRGLSSDDELELYSCDLRDDSPSKIYVKEHFVVPRGTDKDFVKALLKICHRCKIDLLIPVSDFEIRELSKNIDLFEDSGCSVAVSGNRQIEIIGDKLDTCTHIRKLGLQTPETVADEKGISFGFPLMLRTRYSGLHKKIVAVVENKERLRYIVKNTKKPLVFSKFIKGEEYTIDAVASKNGKLLEALPRKRTVVMDGTSKVGDARKDTKMIEEVRTIVEGLGLKGLLCLQCIKKGSKNYYFEINGRAGSGLDLAVDAGVNMPRLCAEDYLGKSPEAFSSKPDYRLRMIRFEDRVLVSQKNKGFLFLDLDGTVLNVAERDYRVYRDILSESGYRTLQRNRYWNLRRKRTPIQEILAFNCPRSFVKSYLREREGRMELQRYLNFDVPVDGAKKALSILSKKYEVYLVTQRKSRKHVFEQLEKHGLFELFGGIITVSKKGKDPAALKAYEIKHFFPGVGIVGDRETDITAGKMAGIKTIAVLTGIRTEEFLRKQKPDDIISSIDKLPKLLGL